MAFSPARVVVTADIKGGANDYEEFYCPSVEWDWGDGTISNQTADCEPYEAGKSEINRHFTADQVFNLSGDFRVEFRLKKKDKTDRGSAARWSRSARALGEIGGMAVSRASPRP